MTDENDTGPGDGTPVTELEGIGESYGGRLSEAGVDTVEDLLEADPGELASETGIGESRIEQWTASARETVDREPDADAGPEEETGAPGEETGEEAGTSEGEAETGEEAGASGEDVEAEEDTGAPGDEVEADEETGEVGEESGEDPGVESPEPATGDAGAEGAPPGEESGSTVTHADEVTGGGEGSGETVASEVDSGGTGASAKSEDELEEEILEPEERVGPGEKFCHNCRAVIDEEVELCPECGVRQDARTSTSSTGSTSTTGGSDEVEPALAAIASLIVPGVGALFTDQTTRAAIWFGLLVAALIADVFIFVISSILTAFVIGIFGFLLIPIIHLVLHAAAAFDAYNQAQKYNAGQLQVD